MFDFIASHIFDSILDLILGALFTCAIAYRKHLWMRFQSIIHWNTAYRVSMAYLFRIKVDNKYLLIKGNRISQYQPVGGVYKYHKSFKDTYERLELQDENNNTFFEENDLRLYVKGRHLNEFIEWFETAKNRECTVDREFREELIESLIFKDSILKNAEFEFLKRINSGIHYSTHFSCKEVLVFDTYDVVFNDPSVKDSIYAKVKETDSIVLVSSEDIKRECIDLNGKSYKIGAHSKYIE